MKTLFDDDRRILTLRCDRADYGVGLSVERITPYYERGPQAAPELWFAVIDQDGDVVSRVNGRHVVAVEYDKPVADLPF